ncbi:MAG: ABC transporter permease, partial [Acidimicrobiia bacterium]|nr:ABC transporter permease [Acidimicrobiia bacterium]
YHAALASPVSVRDLVLGHLAWIVARLFLTAGAFAVVMVLFGASTISEALLAIPPAVLTGLAFGAAITAFTVRQKSEQRLTSLFRFGIVPLFLFSGTFFPIDQLPGFMQPVAIATPLWHGVELTRGAALGIATELPWFVHVGYLTVMAAVGTRMSITGFDKRLRQ